MLYGSSELCFVASLKVNIHLLWQPFEVPKFAKPYVQSLADSSIALSPLLISLKFHLRALVFIFKHNLSLCLPLKSKSPNIRLQHCMINTLSLIQDSSVLVIYRKTAYINIMQLLTKLLHCQISFTHLHHHYIKRVTSKASVFSTVPDIHPCSLLAS